MPQIHIYDSDKSKVAICGAVRENGQGVKKIGFCVKCREMFSNQLKNTPPKKK